MRNKHYAGLWLAVTLTGAILFTACQSPDSPAAQTEQTTPTQVDSASAADQNTPGITPLAQSGLTHSGSGSAHLMGSWKWNISSYTDVDYDLALSFKKEGYADENAQEFDRTVMNWDDEDSYHKTEDALLRLFSSLPDTDPNAAFIFGTLSNVWDNCQMRHYKTCGRESALQHNGSAFLETYGDVYGDQVLLTGAYAEFVFNYLYTDEASLTVGERDSLLNDIENGLKEYLSKQTQDQLSDEKSMKKALEDEMERLLEQLDQKIGSDGKYDLTYEWNAPYKMEAAAYYQDTEASGQPALPDYQECYDLILEKLHFDTYQDMSVAEFNRMVNAAFTESEWEEGTDSFPFSWEYVVSSLPYDDPHYFFLQDTVTAALDEYNARARTVYTQTPVDPSYCGTLQAEKKEDVFGDSLTVAELSADYSITYRILDADRLTVRERDRFLTEINSGAKNMLETSMKEGNTIEKEDIKKALEAASQKAAVDFISLTGCEIDFFEPYYYD